MVGNWKLEFWMVGFLKGWTVCLSCHCHFGKSHKNKERKSNHPASWNLTGPDPHLMPWSNHHISFCSHCSTSSRLLLRVVTCFWHLCWRFSQSLKLWKSQDKESNRPWAGASGGPGRSTSGLKRFETVRQLIRWWRDRIAMIPWLSIIAPSVSQYFWFSSFDNDHSEFRNNTNNDNDNVTMSMSLSMSILSMSISTNIIISLCNHKDSWQYQCQYQCLNR